MLVSLEGCSLGGWFRVQVYRAWGFRVWALSFFAVASLDSRHMDRITWPSSKLIGAFSPTSALCRHPLAVPSEQT